MTRRNLFCLCSLCLLAVAASTSSSIVRGEQDTATAADAGVATLWKDKIVLIEFGQSTGLESESDTVLLQEVRTTKIGGRTFLIGVGYSPADGEDYWYKDMEVGVPCDRVYRFSTMTAEQCAEFMKKWREQLDE